MTPKNQEEAEHYILTQNPNGTEPRHLAHLAGKITAYPCNLAYCADEKTGRRFGQAACRNDKNPRKIGGGGRNKGSRKAWQLWTWEV